VFQKIDEIEDGDENEDEQEGEGLKKKTKQTWIPKKQNKHE